MVDDAIERRLDALVLLLVLAVSLLAGLVIGRTPDDRVWVAAISAVLIGVTLVRARVFRSPDE